MLVRTARLDDCASLAEMRTVLWPDTSAEEHKHELVGILSGEKRLVMLLVIFVAQSEEGELLGFLEAGLRSCAEGCEPWQPVGYIEGWYVGESYRKHGIGRRLLEVAEEWARGQGCVEMASDALLENHLSQRVHQALGYKVVERSVHYRKAL